MIYSNYILIIYNYSYKIKYNPSEILLLSEYADNEAAALWAKMGICGRVLDKYTDLDFISGISKKNNNAYSVDYNTAQQITWEL